jgi:hypothetical protein
MRDDILAILCADIHLTLRPPAARAGEPDWLAAQARPLEQLKGLAANQCPILCAGDVFDRWNAPAELINWAYDHLPYMRAIPGQHDLPFHSYEDVDKSAFKTLSLLGVIKELVEWQTILGGTVQAFPWGAEIEPADGPPPHIAVIHSYIWRKGCSYPGAPDESNIDGWAERLRGYDVAVFGDNHIPFSGRAGACRVVNCGTLQRRKADEHQPQVWLLHRDLTVEPVDIDISEDVFDGTTTATPEKETADFSGFLEELNTLGTAALDFTTAVEHYLESHSVGGLTRAMLIRSLDHATQRTEKGEG